MSDDQGVAVGVIGFGHWGINHLRNFDSLGALRACCDVDPAACERAAALFPAVTVLQSPEELLAEPGIDAVVVATPAVTHGKLARQALDAGKHVLVEKPLCLDVAEAEDLRDHAKQCGRTLMVGHLLLYHPAFRAVQELVASGTLGPLRYLYSNRLSLGKVRREENALWSFAPHDISMILALTGGLPDSVMATSDHYLSDDIADTTMSHLTFPEKIQAHIFVSWLHPFKDHRMVVVAERGMVAFDDVLGGPDKVRLYRHDVGWDGDVPLVTKAEAEAVPYGSGEPLRAECQAFIDAVASGTPPPSDGAEGVRVLKVLQACQQAIHTGERVVMAELEEQWSSGRLATLGSRDGSG